jgi:hypothetical protein
MPRSPPAEPTRASEREGTSLNAYVVATLAAAVAIALLITAWQG